MKQFLRSVPLISVSLMVLQTMTGILSIPVAVVAALLFQPGANAQLSAAGFGTSAALSCLFWLYASAHVRTEQKDRLKTAGYMCTMAAVLFLSTLVLGVGLPMIADFDQNVATIAYWLSKGLWYIAVLYIETGCLLFCWSVDMFVKSSAE